MIGQRAQKVKLNSKEIFSAVHSRTVLSGLVHVSCSPQSPLRDSRTSCMGLSQEGEPLTPPWTICSYTAGNQTSWSSTCTSFLLDPGGWTVASPSGQVSRHPSAWATSCSLHSKCTSIGRLLLLTARGWGGAQTRSHRNDGSNYKSLYIEGCTFAMYLYSLWRSSGGTGACINYLSNGKHVVYLGSYVVLFLSLEKLIRDINPLFYSRPLKLVTSSLTPSLY